MFADPIASDGVPVGAAFVLAFFRVPVLSPNKVFPLGLAAGGLLVADALLLKAGLAVLLFGALSLFAILV